MNKFEKKSRASYNEKANDYDNSAEGKFTLAFNNLIMKNLKINRDDKLLDIACGSGRFLNTIVSKYKVVGYGIDISDVMIENDKQSYPFINFATVTCDNIPFENNMFDVVTISAAYHHFPDVDSFAAEAYRVINDGGKIYIAEIYYGKFLRTILNPFVPLSREGDVKFYAPLEIVSSLKKAGFKNEDIIIQEHIQLIKMEK